MSWGVMAHRSAASVLGASSKWLKGADGERVEGTEAEMRAEADKWNSTTRSHNVWYRARPLRLPSTLRVVCAWCDKEIRGGEEPITHGMCPECFIECDTEDAATEGRARRD